MMEKRKCKARYSTRSKSTSALTSDSHPTSITSYRIHGYTYIITYMQTVVRTNNVICRGPFAPKKETAKNLIKNIMEEILQLHSNPFCLIFLWPSEDVKVTIIISKGQRLMLSGFEMIKKGIRSERFSKEGVKKK